ncbi:MAG TPA: S41 family peptidase [Puia sp.]|nr:S41 family peptidase [Puia sp.]
MLLCLVFLSGHKSDKKQQIPLDTKYSTAAMKADFNQLLAQIKNNHPALYDFTCKDVYQEIVKQQFDKIRDSATVTDFYKILLPLVVKIGCGHSQLWLPQRVWNDSAVGFLPLRLFIEKGKVYIVRNLSTDTNVKISSEVLKINGKMIPDLLDTMNSFISTDGDNLSAKRDYLNTSWFNGLLAIALDFPKEYLVDTRRTIGDPIHQLKLHALNLQTYNRVEAWPSSTPKFLIDSSNNTGILTIRSFSFYDSVAGFRHFIDSFFAKVKQQHIHSVILDLRDNSGGDPFCSAYLLAYLAKAPVIYYSESYEGYAELAKPMPLAADHFEGNLYTLINGNCFSSTGHLCAILKYYHLGKFIGSETDGTYTCNDNSRIIFLNNTGIQLRIARNSFSVVVKGIQRFKGIQPDFPIETNVEDNIAGKDSAKLFALGLIKNEKGP